MRAYYSRVLFDPYSAVFTFAGPPQPKAVGSTVGWVVEGTLNAKNRFGGYVGTKPFLVLIKHGQVVFAVEP